jgi:transposase
MWAFFEHCPCPIGRKMRPITARELAKFGHDAAADAPAHEGLRRQMNDAADAAAICEAVMRPPRVLYGAHRSRISCACTMGTTLVAQRTQLLNALRSHLAEIGIIAQINNARALAVLIMESNDIPAIVSPALLLHAPAERTRSRDRTAIKPFWLARADDTARRR